MYVYGMAGGFGIVGTSGAWAVFADGCDGRKAEATSFAGWRTGFENIGSGA